MRPLKFEKFVIIFLLDVFVAHFCLQKRATVGVSNFVRLSEREKGLKLVTVLKSESFLNAEEVSTS